MPRSESLTRIFKPSEMLDRLDKLEIYESETREAWMIYVFGNDTLAKMEYDSRYDWIERNVRNEQAKGTTLWWLRVIRLSILLKILTNN